MIYDCAIIGAGPAGITAAIQLKRAGFKIIIFEKKRIGGLLWNAHQIENYLGFIKSLSSRELIAIFTRQLKKFGINPVKAKVTKITQKDHFQIQTEKTKYRAKSVIIATGTTPREVGLPGEKNLSGKKLFYEIADFPPRKKPCQVAIIGGGDAGFDYALNLAEKKHQPLIITKNKTKCLELLKKRVKAQKIPYYENITPINIKSGKDQVKITCKEKSFIVDYVLVAVGRQATSPHLDTHDKKGLFIAGDIRTAAWRQIHIATGDGMKAAMDTINYLQQNANRQRIRQRRDRKSLR